ncbi:MAG: hypothetical protein IJQ98_12010, partial [Oscillospiraceae bacterium]|nr:hypothetical protein [Oscillospiraceae bacterium]
RILWYTIYRAVAARPAAALPSPGTAGQRFFHIIKKASIRGAAGFPKPRILGQTGKPRRGADASTATPKPRVESSNLSAPAKNPPDFLRNRADLPLLRAVRGLPESSCCRLRGQIVQSVTPVLNLSVWYSIKIASKALGALQNSALKKRG